MAVAARDQAELAQSMRAILTDICIANSDWSVDHAGDHVLSCFDSCEMPPISVASYMRQVERAAGARPWPQCLILIDQLSRSTGVPVSPVNVHRLVVTAYSIVLKLCVDAAGLTRFVAEAGGVSLDDLVEMECVFLETLEWRVAVGPAAHQTFCRKHHLVQAAARCAVENRGDGPVAMIPDSIVPVRHRFSLKVDDGRETSSQMCGRSGSPTSTSSSRSASAAVSGFAPTPPPSKPSGFPRSQSGPEERPRLARPQAEPSARRSTGSRIASASSYAQSVGLF